MLYIACFHDTCVPCKSCMINRAFHTKANNNTTGVRYTDVLDILDDSITHIRS